MPSSLRTDRVVVGCISLLVGAAVFLAFSPELLSVATGGSKAKFQAGDTVIYRLDKSRREVLSSFPNEEETDHVYELGPVDDPSLETIWVSGSGDLAFADE